MLTNDGELAQLLTHPRHGVEKEYLAEVEGVPSPRRVAARCARASSSTTARPRRPRARWCSGRPPGRAIEIVDEGRPQAQVRRMCEAIGHPVRGSCARASGRSADSQLAPGEWRPLTPDEVRALYAAGARRPARAADAGPG